MSKKKKERKKHVAKGRVERVRKKKRNRGRMEC